MKYKISLDETYRRDALAQAARAIGGILVLREHTNSAQFTLNPLEKPDILNREAVECTLTSDFGALEADVMCKGLYEWSRAVAEHFFRYHSPDNWSETYADEMDWFGEFFDGSESQLDYLYPLENEDCAYRAFKFVQAHWPEIRGLAETYADEFMNTGRVLALWSGERWHLATKTAIHVLREFTPVTVDNLPEQVDMADCQQMDAGELLADPRSLAEKTGLALELENDEFWYRRERQLQRAKERAMREGNQELAAKMELQRQQAENRTPFPEIE